MGSLEVARDEATLRRVRNKAEIGAALGIEAHLLDLFPFLRGA